MKSRIVRLRRSTVTIILVVQFLIIGLLAGGYADLRSAHEFDKRRPYDVCVGSNAQIKKYVDQLTMEIPAAPDASAVEKATAEARNVRVRESRQGLDRIYAENVKECRILLSSDR